LLERFLEVTVEPLDAGASGGLVEADPEGPRRPLRAEAPRPPEVEVERLRAGRDVIEDPAYLLHLLARDVPQELQREVEVLRAHPADAGMRGAEGFETGLEPGGGRRARGWLDRDEGAQGV